MGAPGLAIVIPLLNERQGLEQLIARLRTLEIDGAVFVDGGSTDGTREILAEAGVKWLDSPPGRATQMNLGARHVNSDIILFLHADTTISSGCISALVDTMSDARYVAGRFDVRLTGRHPAFRLIETMINLRSRLSGISTGDQAMFVRRRVFEEVGGFPDQPLLEDVEMSRKLKRAGPIACLGQRVETSSRRWERNGILRTVLLMWRLRFLYWLGVDPGKLRPAYENAR